MDKNAAIDAERALLILETYDYPKIKSAVKDLRKAFNPIIENEKKKEIRAKNNLTYSYGGWEPLKKMAATIELLTNSINLYEEAAKNLEKTQNSTQDILHAIELCELDENESLKLVRELHEVRRIRREAKDFTDVMLPMYNLAYKYQELNDELKKVMSEMNKEMKFKENRKYNPREKTDLKEKFQAAGQ